MTPEQISQYKQYVISQGLSPEQADKYIAYVSQAESGSLPVEQVQSPLVTASDRLIVKNLANSPDAAAAYIKKKNPNAQIRVENGEIQILAPGGEAWQVVDPDTGILSRDFLADVGDLAFDAGSGVLQSAATALGTGVGAFGGPAGAVGGGIGASAVSSGALEAARQKLGQIAGIPQDVNPMDVAASTVAGGVSTGLFGGGSTKGLLQKGYEYTKGKILPKVGQLISGVPSEAITHYAGNMSRIDDLGTEGITKMVQDTTNKAQMAGQRFKNRAGKAVAEAVDSAGEQVDITPAKDAFRDRIAQLRGKSSLTNADLSEIDELEKAFARQFTGPAEGPLMQGQAPLSAEISDQANARRAFDLQQRLKQLAQFNRDITPETAAMQKSAGDSYRAINQGLDDVTEKVSGQAKANYRQALEAEDFIDRNFANPEKTFGTLSGLDRKNRQLVVERLKKYADDGMLDLTQEAKDMQAYKYFHNPATTPLGMQGATSTSRTVPLAMLGGTLGYYAGAQSGMGQGGAGLGAGAGALLGSKAGSAAAIKQLIKMGVKTDDAIQALSRMGGYSPNIPLAAPLMTPAVESVMSPWMQMLSNESQ